MENITGRIFKLGMAVALALAVFYFLPPLEGKNHFFNVASAKAESGKKIAKRLKKKKTKESSAYNFPVKIIGDAGCAKETNLALNILQKKSRSDYEKVINSIGVVECAEKSSGVYVFENPARFKVGRVTYQAEKNWYASALVHESCHVDQYRSYLTLNSNQKVPLKVFSGADAENECLFTQYNALIHIGANQPLLDYVKKIAETNYWDISAEKRWW